MIPTWSLEGLVLQDFHLFLGALRAAAFTGICSVEPNSSQNVIALGRFSLQYFKDSAQLLLARRNICWHVRKVDCSNISYLPHVLSGFISGSMAEGC